MTVSGPGLPRIVAPATNALAAIAMAEHGFRFRFRDAGGDGARRTDRDPAPG